MLATFKEFSAILRADLLAFAQKCFVQLHPGTKLSRNWHHEAICHQLECVLSGDAKRLIINLPPRSLKSFLVSVVFPAFVLGKKPSYKIVCISYSADLAVKHASDFRKIVESDWYKSSFRPDDPFKSTETEYQTAVGGFRYTTSVDGTLTGRGGDLFIIDDPINAADAISKTSRDRVNDWFVGALLQRLDDKKAGAVIVVMQRLQQDDLSGFLLEQQNWRQLILPAIAPNDIAVPLSATRNYHWCKDTPLDAFREPLSVLNAHKKLIGAENFQTQYLQTPTPESGNLLKREWIRQVDQLPSIHPNDEIVQSWDTAMKATSTSDYSVCFTFLVRNKNEYHLIDVYRDRPEFPELAKLVVSHAQKYRAHAILIEDRVSGTSLIQEAKRRGLQGVIGCKPSSDKVSRMQAQTPKLESGSLIAPRSAPWFGDFMTEYLAFPKGRHDDQIDALSQFLEWRRNSDDCMFECHWI